jgi:archaemetzincin
MNLLRLLPVGTVDTALLESLRGEIPQRFLVDCEISRDSLDPIVAYHPERQQYHSSEILEHVTARTSRQDWRILAVTAVDLYIPILKYVFGEAQLQGRCALVSYYRLRQEFYGLERDQELLAQRVLKECIHELGHTLGLAHCQDYRCAMASAHAVEWIDIREDTLCEACRAKVEVPVPASRRSWW